MKLISYHKNNEIDPPINPNLEQFFDFYDIISFQSSHLSFTNWINHLTLVLRTGTYVGGYVLLIGENLFIPSY
jgi:hypothetical protein